MGIFSWLKPRPRPSAEQLSYDIAYRIFPHYAFEQMQSVLDLMKSDPETAGDVFHHIACKSSGIAHEQGQSGAYRLHLGQIDDSHLCLTMEYPWPKPLPASLQSFKDATEAIEAGAVVLAPYFSLALRHSVTGAIDYFVLGQSFTESGTVIRTVDKGGSNKPLGLGPGPEPKLNLFLAEIRRYLASRA